jgi:hypothetical protein
MPDPQYAVSRDYRTTNVGIPPLPGDLWNRIQDQVQMNRLDHASGDHNDAVSALVNLLTNVRGIPSSMAFSLLDVFEDDIVQIQSSIRMICRGLGLPDQFAADQMTRGFV